jgi:release factor glutamine methyltransferase
VKIFEAIATASTILSDSNTPQLDAEVILSRLLNKERVYLYLNRIEELPNDIVKEFFKLIERRKKAEPVQYITGNQEFMSMEFAVKPGVLIPRPDTEILVEEVLKNIKEITSPVIVDVGCGSGAISTSLAKYKTDSFVYALDIMDTPIEVTRINSDNNGVNKSKGHKI